MTDRNEQIAKDVEVFLAEAFPSGRPDWFRKATVRHQPEWERTVVQFWGDLKFPVGTNRVLSDFVVRDGEPVSVTGGRAASALMNMMEFRKNEKEPVAT